MFTRTTHSIKITVQPAYLETQSDPEDNLYVWSYTILLENQGTETVQLVSRYWHITDALGHVQEVRGAGVVGEQPVLEPGATFRYTSGVPLKTSSGIMQGTYQMVHSDGGQFEVEIPAFSLDSPYALLQPN
jgi:ApaG protein